MVEDITYKVLWVDDQKEIVESTKLDADKYGIELDHYSNWQEAETALENNFEDYTAIILDAYCQIKPTENIKEEFINAVLPSLSKAFGRKQKFIPWYILSAGTMNLFSHTVNCAEYQHNTEEWGRMLYIKDVPDEDPKNSHFLFENIRRVGKNQSNNIVLFRHKEVFSYLGKDKLIDERARTLMLKMLSVLYAPDENIKYEYAGNPLRKVLEYIFRAARKMGFLTSHVFDADDHLILLNASRYLAGFTIDCYEGKTVVGNARWGNEGPKRFGGGGDSVFPNDISSLVLNILNYSSSESHTEEETPYFIDELNKELFLGYVLQLCHVIKWFGKYTDQHPNVEENRKKQVEIKQSPKEKNPEKKKKEEKKDVTPHHQLSAEDYIGKKYMISSDGVTRFCGRCKLDPSISLSSQLITIEEVAPNEGDDMDKYPYIVTRVSLNN